MTKNKIKIKIHYNIVDVNITCFFVIVYETCGLSIHNNQYNIHNRI